MNTQTLSTGRLLLTSTALLILAGCSFGPGVMESSRSAYNKAVANSSNEELLLNMVRLRYSEPVQFLQIGNITAQYSYGANLSVNGKFPGNGANVYTGLLGANISEKPTISYKPLEGKAFVNRMLEETSLSTVLLLIRSGWNIERVSRIMMSRIGHLENFPKHPSYVKFKELIQLWEEAHQRHDLIFVQLPGKEKTIAKSLPEGEVNIKNLISVAQAGYAIKLQSNGKYAMTQKGKPLLVMEIKYQNAAEAERADALLGVQPQHIIAADGRVVEHIQFTDPLVNNETISSKGSSVVKIPLVMRSFSNQLFGLASGIELPKKGSEKVETQLNIEDAKVNVHAAIKDILNIQTSDGAPDNALVSVKYRGSWFYIDRDDRQSMSTFALLTLLYSLQAGEEASGPVLTIPIGG